MADVDDDFGNTQPLDTRFFSIHRRRSTARTADDVLKQVEKFSARFSTTGRRKSESSRKASTVEAAGLEEVPALSPGGVNEALKALQIPNSTLSSDDDYDDGDLGTSELQGAPILQRGNSVVFAVERFLSNMEAERAENREMLRTSSAVIERGPHVASRQQLPEVEAVERRVFALLDDDAFEDWLNLGDVRRVGDEFVGNASHLTPPPYLHQHGDQHGDEMRPPDAVASRFVVGGGFGKRVMDSLARGEFAPHLIFDELDLSDPLAGIDKSKLAEALAERRDSGYFPPSRKSSIFEDESTTNDDLPDKFATFLRGVGAETTSGTASAIRSQVGEVISFLKERQSAAEAPCAPWTLKQVLTLANEVNAALEEGDDADYFLFGSGTVVPPPSYVPRSPNIFRGPSPPPCKSGTDSVTTGYLVSCPASPNDAELKKESRTSSAIDAESTAVTAYEFTQRRLLPALSEMGKHLYQLEWAVRYAIAFLNALFAVDEEDAWIREEISGRCVTLEYLAQALQRESLRLEDNILRHDDFAKIKASSERCKEDLLVPAEETLKMILTQCPFRDQRALLKRHQNTITAAVNKATLFFQEFDSSWTCFITAHAKWKSSFLDSGFVRLQGIAHGWMTATLGFIDPVLNKQVVDRNTRDVMSYKKRITVAEVVRRLVVENNADLTSVAVEIKGVSSRIVGLQLSMAARYLCDQTAEKFDKDWQFSMSYSRRESDSESSVSQPAPVAGSQADQEVHHSAVASPRSVAALNLAGSPKDSSKSPFRSELQLDGDSSPMQ